MSDEQMMGGAFIGVNGATEEDMLEGVDPGVKKLVRWLRANGFNTTDSGDGKTKFELGFSEDDGVCLFAHVAIVVPKHELAAEVDRLADLLLNEHRVAINALGPEDDGPAPPRIDGSYCGGSGIAMIILENVDDSMLVGCEGSVNEI